MNNSVHVFIRITVESLIKGTVNYDTAVRFVKSLSRWGEQWSVNEAKSRPDYMAYFVMKAAQLSRNICLLETNSIDTVGQKGR